MRATDWNNGGHRGTGAGYGLKKSTEDRARYFDRGREAVSIRLPDGSDCAVNISKCSFWNETRRELISKESGLSLIASGSAP